MGSGHLGLYGNVSVNAINMFSHSHSIVIFITLKKLKG